MDTKDVKTIAMCGPSISEPERIVNRDVPICDEQAFKAAGYVRGSIVESVDDEVHKDGTPKVTYTEADVAAQVEVKPKGKGKK